MTNIEETMNQLIDLGYRCDPGFNGNLTRVNGSSALVIAEYDDGAELQLFWLDTMTDRDGDPRWEEVELEEPVLVHQEVVSIERLDDRVKALDLVVEMDTAYALKG